MATEPSRQKLKATSDIFKGVKRQTASDISPCSLSGCSLCQKVINGSHCSESARSITRQDTAYVLWSEYVNSAKECSNCNFIKARLQGSKVKSAYASHKPDCRLQIGHGYGSVVNIKFDGFCCKSTENRYVELQCPHEDCGSEHYIPVNDKIEPGTILHWIQDCDQDHKCTGDIMRMRRVSKSAPSMILVDLELNCLTQITEFVKYTCLSYVWGHTGSSLTTTRKNLDELSHHGALIKHAANIPRTIRHAMIVTKTLGIRFLWVDRFCIIQDDEEAKNEQIELMSSIYACSYFTIIAASGSDDQYGLPGVVHPRKLRRHVLCLNNSAQFAVNDVSSWDEKVDTYSRRAWTFQERLLPSRCLVFYQNTVKWECREATSFELCGSSDIRLRGKNQFSPKLNPDPKEIRMLIGDYSGRDLTFQKDALNAFAAILSYLEPSFPGGFFFGLPEGAFHNALLWQPWINPTHVRRNEFPSWSWLGWKGQSYLIPEATISTANGEAWKTNAIYCKPQIPLVEWFKQVRNTRHFVPIRNFHSQWRSFARDLNSGFQIDALQAAPAPELGGLRRWSPFLHGRVQIGKLKMGKQLWDDYRWDDQPRFRLLDVHDTYCGTAELTDIKRPTSGAGDFCDILPVSRGEYTLEGLKKIGRGGHRLESLLRKSGDETTWHSIIHAMWIQWENGIAYRQGLCHILAKLWDTVYTQEVDIILG